MYFVATHPLIRHKLARLRHKDTSTPQFRELVYEISQYLFYEATNDAKLRDVTVPTPLVTARCHELADRIGIIPVLRAGLGMANAMLDALPEASVWHIGMARDHATWLPETYYKKLPGNDRIEVGLVLDPMLATGGSAIETLTLLKTAGIPRLKFVGLIASPEGVAALQAAHPDVDIYLAALDDKLDENKYIVPGLGDAGDRQFGTG
jgi:uracil phosphoribosyltransferase